MTWSGASSGEHFVAANPPSTLIAKGPSPWYDVTHPSFGATNAHLTTGANLACAAANAAGGGIVFVPPGSWVCDTGPVGGSATIGIVAMTNVTLQGAGINATTFTANAALVGGNADLIRMAQSSGSFYSFVTIRNLTLDCSAQTAGNGMTAQGVNGLTTEYLRIIKAWGFGTVWGTIGGAAPYVTNHVARVIYCEGCGRGIGNDSLGGGGVTSGVVEDYFCTDAADGTFVGGTAWDNTNMQSFVLARIFATTANPASVAAIQSDFGAVNLTIRDVWVKGFQDGVTISSTSSGQAKNVVVDGLHCLTVRRAGVFHNVTATFGVQGFKVLNSDFTVWDSAAAASPCIILDGGHDVVLANNTFGAVTTGYAIRVRGDAGSVVANPATNVQIFGNDVKLPTNTIFLQFLDPNGTTYVHDNPGFNPIPLNQITTPGFPTSTTTVTNATGTDVDVYITSGTNAITPIRVNANIITNLQIAAAGATGGPIRVAAGGTINLTYAAGGAPSWLWVPV